MRLFRQFQAAGYRPASDGEPIDVYVLNSCTVTHVADSKARQAIRSLRRRHPDATVVATGCYAERSPGELRRMAEVDLVIGNSEKEAIVARVMAYRDDVPAACAVGDDPATQLPRIGRTRAMVRIQRGCDQVCAYCIVPKVRGRERSVPPDEIVAEIDGYATLGYREAVLTGTQLGSYGFDIPGMSLTLTAGASAVGDADGSGSGSHPYSRRTSTRSCCRCGWTRGCVPISTCLSRAAVTGYCRG